MRTNHIFPETLVYSVRTPTLDELLKVHEEQVWSHPVVKLEILKQWRNRDYGNKSQNINKKSDNYLIPKIIKSLSRYYVANVSHILNKKEKKRKRKKRENKYRYTKKQITWVRNLISGCFKMVYIWVAISIVNLFPMTQYWTNASLHPKKTKTLHSAHNLLFHN